MHYLVHKLKYFDEVIIGYFLPGHSKNECDADFGNSKSWLLKHGKSIQSYPDVIESIRNSRNSAQISSTNAKSSQKIE